MEILAKKQRGLTWQYVFTTVMGVIFMCFEIAIVAKGLRSTGKIEFILPILFITAVGIVIIVTGVVTCLRIKKTPDCITLNGTQVDLGNGLIVHLSQIENVDYRESRGRYNRMRWGKLTIYVENQKIDYYYMADVQHARDRIMQLKNKAGLSEL